MLLIPLTMKTTWPIVLLLASALAATVRAAEGGREPLPWRVPARLPDVAELPAPAAVRLDGFLGHRVANNANERLRLVNEEPILAGFKKKPGSHPWIGEHVGKWLHAATLAWSYTGDPELRTKVDRVVRELIAAQEADGYLGTYTPNQRFGLYPGADWDVWSHKYNLIGLLTYYQYTGDDAALAACRKMGDLLLRTFGPGRKSILSAGTHVGMAATSVLEPMVLLHRATGDPRYLDFARYLVQAWDEPNGPRIMATLLREKSVAKTANGKAYEMLSNLVGLCELARATGEREWLEPVLIAWEDIVAHRLYLTGSASQGEHFKADYFLPNEPSAHVSETCVTTTWIQLNSQLLRLTGEARFGDELEKTFVNHLTAAQRPDGAQWCYFTPLAGTKDYGPGINCCVSSGPRGMALVPPHAWFTLHQPGTRERAVVLNLFEMSRATLMVDGEPVTLDQFADPAQPGRLTVTVHTPRRVRFSAFVRTPEWARPLRIEQRGRTIATTLEGGWTRLPLRRWRDGDQFVVLFNLSGRVITGDHGNAGRAAAVWGPAVLAYDEAFNPSLGPITAIGLASEPGELPVRLRTEPDGSALFEVAVRSARQPGVQRAQFVFFADAGSQGSRYRIWLPAPGAALPRNDSLFAFATESRSRSGNVSGSISDGDASTFVVTFDGRPQADAWFAVSSPTPVELRRVSFAHGQTFHDGGWFDATAGKPEIQIQREKDGPWETVARLESYPATSATDAAGLRGGERITVTLPKAVRALGVRIMGKPACGDNAQQGFASCAELQGLAE